jgi:MinD superfamily P-loop ATPase
LAVEAVRVLGVPHGLIINRSDLGNQDVWTYARSQDVPILMEIPFDRALAEVYSRGELIVEAFPEWKERFAELWDVIARQAEQQRKESAGV